MTQFTRRRFLEILSVSASTVALSGCLSDDEGNEYAVLAPEFFPQSLASGDPRESSVIVWTRVQAAAGDTQDRQLILQVSTDADFKNLFVEQSFTAKADHDHCLKVRVTALEADTFYYYRFVLKVGDKYYRSRTGRTRTAPSASSSRTVKFAYVSCQDFIGRFYNPYMKMAAMDLDFIVHLGDYVYETTGDPRFQSATSSRKVQFSDVAGAIVLGSAPNQYYAAQSLSNYRDLYKTYRSDSALQLVHENFPFVCIWDDHEFADDSFGATSTHSNDVQIELNEDRKRNAERAYFDYMPVDIHSSQATQIALEQTSGDFYPETTLYRDFRFGSNVHLVMTDFRSHRPDHLIPEHAFPGHVALDKAACIAVFTSLAGGDAVAGAAMYEATKASFKPYIDLGTAPFNAYSNFFKLALTSYYMIEGASAARADALATALSTAKLNAEIAKGMIDSYNADLPPGGSPVPPISEAIFPTLDRGVDFSLMGKGGVFGELGSRYFVVKSTYDMYAGYRYAVTGGAAQNAYGQAQMAWLTDTLAASTARWKVLGSSVSMTSLMFDLRSPSLGVPAPFNQQFYLNVDHWDGFPQQRQAIKALLPAGSIVISGDIHASYVSEHGNGVHEFTGTSISSATSSALLRNTANTAESFAAIRDLVAVLIARMDTLMQAANPAIKYARSNGHGFSVISASSTQADVTYYEWDESTALNNSYALPAAIEATAKVRRFRINDENVLEVLP